MCHFTKMRFMISAYNHVMMVSISSLIPINAYIAIKVAPNVRLMQLIVLLAEINLVSFTIYMLPTIKINVS